jgi:hypothetical protein
MQRYSPRTSPRQSPRSAPNAMLGGSTIPRTGLIFYAKAPGMVDSIGLSAAALWAALPAELRSIFCVDENNRRDVDDAYALARVSEYLNMGEMVGRGEGRGVAVYTDGTDSAILLKACKYFNVTFGEQYYDTDIAGKSVFGTPDIGAYER